MTFLYFFPDCHQPFVSKGTLDMTFYKKGSFKKSFQSLYGYLITYSCKLYRMLQLQQPQMPGRSRTYYAVGGDVD